MQIELTGKVSVVTGGASGIGLACAKALIGCGSQVTILDTNSQGRSAAAEIGAKFIAVNIKDEDTVEKVAAEIGAGRGGADILVTAAGVLQPPKPPENLNWLIWDEVQAVHVRGTYVCCRAFGSKMAARKSGSIVTISSVAGMSSGPLHAYGPAKAAIIQLTAGLAGEWGRSNVRVNSVAPGFTDTPALERGIKRGSINRGQLESANAMGRLASADEVAASVVFLASDLSSATTGAVLPVDCGHLAAAGWQAYGGVHTTR
ncbi:MAG: SDR family oxidoreductase [Hyphomicrobiales bacterium]|nr:SDR family oxidoreductase [Hyphomicrobiales bacterium]MCP4999263.1 SDR family oxidoreductase [Hyphomicrobiales bacterium]